jgi:peptidoglycan/xylan/chitin deacetylase (PgdA/CDA1 family)
LFRKYKYDPPALIKKIFRDFCWNTLNNKILLTFDDGPNPGTTEKILKFLSDKKIKALFFCLGNNIQKQSGLTAEILNEGHIIGNHTFNHKSLTSSTRNEIIDDINRFSSLLKNKFNYDTEFFRPPYGRFNLSTGGLLKERNLKNVMWSLLTYDYKNDINLIKLAAIKYLKKNSIIVLHDSIKSKDVVLEGMEIIFDEAGKRGFEIGEPAECLK